MTGSQFYAHGRLQCLAGYREIPSIAGHMTFMLRQFPLFSSRFVRAYGRVFELWSPNSAIPAYLPGLPAASPLLLGAPAPLQRRYDGHTGKHDCLHVPQYSQEATRYWAYMRRASSVQSGDWNAEAYLPFIEQWVDEGRRGHLAEGFISRLSAIYRELERRKQELDRRHGATLRANYPQFPSELDIQRLTEVKSWEEAVDRAVPIQRGLREKEGWLEERLAHLSTPGPRDIGALRARDMPVSLDYRMGAWVNGCSELTVLTLMAMRAPVFVVCELDAEEAALFTDSAASNFLEGTDVEQTLSEDNPYQRIAAEQFLLDSLLRRGTSISFEPDVPPIQRRWASSSFLFEQPGIRRDVWMGTEGERLDWQLLSAPRRPVETPRASRASLPLRTIPPTNPVTTTARTRPRPFPSTPSLPPTSSSGWGSAAWPRSDRYEENWGGNSNWGSTESERLPRPHAPPTPSPAPAPSSNSASSSSNKYAAPDLEYRVVDAEHVHWIVAPDVAPENTATQNKYERYVLRQIGEVMMWVRVSNRGELHFRNQWVDRVRRRRLYFGDFVLPSGIVDVDVFGAPVPRYQFVVLDGNKYTPMKASHWMYRTDAPLRGDAGKKQRAPHPNQLPKWADISKGKDTVKAKGKAVAPYADDDDDDDDVEGMDVDVNGPTEAERPSECVVLDGVDSEHTAAMFQGFSADQLWGARARPTAILNARRRIWLRFATVEEGQRALGAMANLGYGVEASFTSVYSFEDARLYTRDIWTPDLMEDIVESTPTISTTGVTRERLPGEPSLPPPPSQLSPTSPAPPRSPPPSVSPPPRSLSPVLCSAPPQEPVEAIPSLPDRRVQVPQLPPTTSPSLDSAPIAPAPAAHRPPVSVPRARDDAPTPSRPTARPPAPRPAPPAAQPSRSPPKAPRQMRLPLENRPSDAPVHRSPGWAPAVSAPRPVAPLPHRSLAARLETRGNLLSLLPRLSDASAPASSNLHRGGQSMIPLPLRLSTPPPSSSPAFLHPLLDTRVSMNNFGEIIVPAPEASTRQPGREREVSLRIHGTVPAQGSSNAARVEGEREGPPRKKKKVRRGNRAGVQAKAQEERRERLRREGFEEEPQNLRWHDDDDEDDPPVAGPSH
ncbi:hypothetical protein C8R46DRAFT_1224094 [Mycena filopes]|nr:hypothetical protein C8R46DRAFT_1224094 [Mycena filopes]